MPTTTKTKTKVATVTDLGRQYFSRHVSDVIFTRGQWHDYANGVWTPYHDQIMNRRIWRLLEEFEAKNQGVPNLGKHSGIIHYLKSKYFVREEEVDAQPSLINLLNGTYNLADNNLYPHDPDHYITTQLPFDYDRQAAANTWQMYLMSTFVKPRSTEYDEELAEFVQEAIGYSLTTNIEHHVTFWCLGEGANGKGVLFHVLEQLGGSGAMPLNIGRLKQAQYQLANLAGKTVALCSESSATDNLVEDALVKALISGDTMNVRQIRKEPFALHPTVKLWWSMNRLPAVADTSTGFWRRVRVVPFNRLFGPREQILDLKDRLDMELPGIFAWAMRGLKRLHDRGRFVEPIQVIDSTATYKRESNNVLLYIEDVCEVDPSVSVASASIYASYKDWCKDNTYKPFSSKNFKREMEQLGYFATRRAAGVFFDGLTIKVVWP